MSYEDFTNADSESDKINTSYKSDKDLEDTVQKCKEISDRELYDYNFEFKVEDIFNDIMKEIENINILDNLYNNTDYEIMRINNIKNSSRKRNMIFRRYDNEIKNNTFGGSFSDYLLTNRKTYNIADEKIKSNIKKRKLEDLERKRDCYGINTMLFFCTKSFIETNDHFYLDIVNILLEKGCDKYSSGASNITPFKLSFKSKNQELMSAFGININIESNKIENTLA